VGIDWRFKWAELAPTRDKDRNEFNGVYLVFLPNEKTPHKCPVTKELSCDEARNRITDGF
jgi:hypothetical protein